MQFFLGGYFLIRNLQCEDRSAVPHHLFSVSNCVSDVLPDTWAWDQALSKKTGILIKKKLQLTDAQFEEIRMLTVQMLSEKRIQLPYVFSELEEAREYYKKHFSHVSNVKLLGIAIEQTFLDEFLETEDDVNLGIADNLASLRSINLDGKFNGYELLGYEFWSFHSMYCHDKLINHLINILGIDLNENGLIKEYEDAIAATMCIRENIVPVEPALWQPWAIYEYAI